LQDADKYIDFDRGFEFLDKELEQLYPEQDLEHPRFIDKLIKAYTLEGKEEWILIHIEVQGYYEKDFPKRMFRYFYRLLDKYDKQVTALAIFTDNNQQFNPQQFDYRFLGTSLAFRFNTYKIMEQNEDVLHAHDNPFALVVLTALTALKHKKLDDEALFRLKIELFRKLYQRKMDKKTMQAIATFLKLYVHFSKPETNTIFEASIQSITENKLTMGIEELVLNRAEQKGIEKGKAEGKAEGKTEEVRNLIIKLGLNDEQAADVAGVSVEFVQQVRASLQQNG
jgi:predicted transposase/invertase (TIGR01784 family)